MKRAIRSGTGVPNRFVRIGLILLMILWSGSYTLAQKTYSPSSSQVLVLAGGTLIDGTGGNPIRDAVVLIQGSRIQAVGPRGRVTIPKGARVVHTTNQFILPGLIESHFHFADWMPGELLLSFGVTSAVHFGPPIAQAKPPDSDPLSWPRIFFSGETLATPAQWTFMGKAMQIGKVATPEQVQETVRQRKQAGAIFITVGENVGPDLLKAVVQQAHALGLPVIGHQLDAIEAIHAGLDAIEHVTAIALSAITNKELFKQFEELQKHGPTYTPYSHPISNPEYYMESAEVEKIIKLMIQRGTYLNPTMVTRWQRVEPRTKEFAEQYKTMAEHPAWSSIPENVRRTWTNTLIPYPEWTDQEHKDHDQIAYRKTQDLLRNFTKAGGKIFSGSDFAGASVPGLRLHQELQLLVDAGLTPMQAILTATRYPAELFHLDRELGMVRAGRLADLVVVEANPLENITNLKRISHVFVGGREFKVRFRPDGSSRRLIDLLSPL